jgi:hypothetical protein
MSAAIIARPPGATDDDCDRRLLGGTKRIVILAIIATSVVAECQATFSPSRRRHHHHHHRRRRPRFASPSLHDAGCAHVTADDDLSQETSSRFSYNWSSVASIALATAVLLVNVESVDALGTPSSIFQYDRAGGQSSSKFSMPIPQGAANTVRYSTLFSPGQSASGSVAAPKIESIVNAVKEIISKDLTGATLSKLKLAKPKTSAKERMPSDKSQMIERGELKVIDVKKIAEEGRIDVELIYKQRPLDLAVPIVKIDRETFQKVKVYQPPAFLQYLPSAVQPLVSGQFQSFRVLKSISNEQLFVASVFAGSVTEIVRAVLLYPLSTIKSRVQARKRKSLINNRKRSVRRKLRVSWLTFLYETKRGDLYAGILPTLLVSVPASGVYSGAKEVSKRVFSMAVKFQFFQNLVAASPYYSALAVNLMAAFVADIAALAIRTPADVLSLRLQVFGKTNVRSDFGNWAKDSVALLPAMIITDTPLLLSRIFLNAAITTSGENLGQYEFETITIGEWN